MVPLPLIMCTVVCNSVYASDGEPRSRSTRTCSPEPRPCSAREPHARPSRKRFGEPPTRSRPSASASRQPRRRTSIASNRSSTSTRSVGRDVAVAGWILDKSAAARVGDAGIRGQLDELAGGSGSARSASSSSSSRHGRRRSTTFSPTSSGAACIERVAPADIFERALALQRDLAHHQGLWHRVSIPDLLIAETALHHGLGVVHVDADYERIAEVRPLTPAV